MKKIKAVSFILVVILLLNMHTYAEKSEYERRDRLIYDCARDMVEIEQSYVCTHGKSEWFLRLFLTTPEGMARFIENMDLESFRKENKFILIDEFSANGRIYKEDCAKRAEMMKYFAVADDDPNMITPNENLNASIGIVNKRRKETYDMLWVHQWDRLLSNLNEYIKIIMQNNGIYNEIEDTLMAVYYDQYMKENVYMIFVQTNKGVNIIKIPERLPFLNEKDVMHKNYYLSKDKKRFSGFNYARTRIEILTEENIKRDFELKDETMLVAEKEISCGKGYNFIEIPLRKAMESMGYEVEYNAQNGNITLSNNGNSVVLEKHYEEKNFLDIYMGSIGIFPCREYYICQDYVFYLNEKNWTNYIELDDFDKIKSKLEPIGDVRLCENALSYTQVHRKNIF